MEEKVSILVVEDEEKIRSALTDFLEFHNFEVTEAADGLEAERVAAEKRFDLILLDLMLPKISGEQLCSRWRNDGLQTPIIMLTAKGQEKEKVAGLNLGADDYITKPFSLEELLARINAVLRRTDPARAVGQTFKFANPNRVIDREELYKAVWDETMSELGTRTVDMHIAKLRSKIELDVAEPQIIKTVRGAGYKYESDR